MAFAVLIGIKPVVAFGLEKINYVHFLKIYSIALESEDYVTADTIHVSLMVDHISEVSQWMVGVKRLIATLKQQKS